MAILPIFLLFLSLPLSLHTLQLTGTFAAFISWLANFKLLLFAFGKGPLSDPSLSLKQFIAIASCPIKTPNGTTITTSNVKTTVDYVIMVLVFGMVLRSYKYKDSMHPIVLSCLYCVHIYLFLEIILGMAATLVRTLFGIELEPQFNEPYLASSLQDFWSRRWNLVTANILRLTVFEPIRYVMLPLIGPMWATLSSTFVAFLISGLMHELMFYYLGRVRPTWEITCFFLLHGSCLMVEVPLKKKLGAKFQLPRIVSGILTIGFVMVTAHWLYFPQLLRCNGYQRALEEYAAIGRFVKSVALGL
ncbi:hypothetical protein PIB30_036022 [Stylosanthes scabra]|uniref:Wax synthase domain-containing protein n=1 Tax=Stylosanthes scabra TaxID=79078 RepID=A0ABU6XDF5_9FABA|nr:hypothetical protein [Stylosanthes scabra]